MPSLVGKTKEEAEKSLEEYGMEIEIMGEGTVVTEQFPVAGEKVKTQNNVILWLE